MSEVQQKGHDAKQASVQLAAVTTEEKNAALRLIAEQLATDKQMILKANANDLNEGRENGLTEALLDRIMLNDDRLQAIGDAISQVIELNDPIGELLETVERDNGLTIQKKRVPIGVIGMIYEARPNVTIDAATLTLKTGNAVVLKGSSSALFSNTALVQSIHRALKKSALPVDAVQLIEDTNRETAKELFQLHDYLDVLIPRGGKKLIDTVVREATVPVIETGAGNCHLFIDETAEPEMAEQIVLNAKLQRPSVCNAVESILIHEKWFEQHASSLLNKLEEHNVTIYADEKITKSFPATNAASEEDWHKEYLGLSVSVKLVRTVDEAIQHINKYGTKHSEAIITENNEHAAAFQQQVDAAAVYHNASTRFTDGSEFGYGAEIGISTQKLHARGPIGLPSLTSSKFFIYGDGQVRKA